MFTKFVLIICTAMAISACCTCNGGCPSAKTEGCHDHCCFAYGCENGKKITY